MMKKWRKKVEVSEKMRQKVFVPLKVVKYVRNDNKVKKSPNFENDKKVEVCIF